MHDFVFKPKWKPVPNLKESDDVRKIVDAIQKQMGDCSPASHSDAGRVEGRRNRYVARKAH